MDLASKNVVHLQGGGVGNIGLVGCAKQRSRVLALVYAYLRVGGSGAFRRGVAALSVGLDFEPLRYVAIAIGAAGSMVVAQPCHGAVFVEPSFDGSAGVKSIAAARVFVLYQNTHQALLVDIKDRKSTHPNSSH